MKDEKTRPAAPLLDPGSRSSPHLGLGRSEVEALRATFGFNEVPVRAAHPALRLLGKFWSLSAWMLEGILVLSAVLEKYAEGLLVAALLVINALLSFYQEQRSAAVVKALEKRLAVLARVRRDGLWQLVPSRELVPGDLLRIRQGDIVPADARLSTGVLSVDQSALTGESLEVDRRPTEVLLSGSLVRSGEGDAIVQSTGAQTRFGRTARLVQGAQPQRHIETVVAGLVRWLLLIVGTLVAVVFALALARGFPLVEILPLMLVLLMSAVPLALPVIYTVSTAMGSRDLAKQGVLVTHLSAAEDAATMDTLCFDKTGTITLNQLAVTGVVPWNGATEAEVLLAGALASRESNQDPLDLAFLAAAQTRIGAIENAESVSFVPFTAESRMTQALVEQSGQRSWVFKGAVRTIAEACAFTQVQIAQLETEVAVSAGNGHRTLAVAKGGETGTPVFLGLVTLYDPPRPDAAALMTALRALGVSVKMLTGDALPVAREIAGEVGLPDVRSVTDLKTAVALGAAQTAELLGAADGFAEVFPEDKFLVVKSLQASGHVAGMTGDGVNDAPALRQSEVGIALSTATDVAKSAASVVLTQPGLIGIVALIQQGRAVHQRVLSWIINKISRTILKAAVVALAYAATGKLVVSTLAMLVLVFLTDFAKIALATDVVRPSPNPETWKIGGFVAVSAVLGVVMVGETLGLIFWGWSRFGLGSDDQALSTFSFLALLYFAVFSVVSARERQWFWSTSPSKTLIAALAANLVIGTALTLIGVPGLSPLPWGETLGVFCYAVVICLGINDALKVFLIRWWTRPGVPPQEGRRSQKIKVT